MHELSITRQLLDSAVRAAAGRSISAIHARVGRLTGVSPDALQFYFDLLRDETAAAGATLSVTLEPLRGACVRCHAPVTREELDWTCPACGEGSVVFDNGSELQLQSLVVNDDRADHDRAEDPGQKRRHRPREPA
jgi:hydrogenase nickel incorporation protein HypA/HybF